MKKRVVMVSMTHWDREHARPFEQFRWHLVYNVLDKALAALDGGTLPSFTLDGQVIPLEDYLAIRPERAEEVARRVREGTLLIGPFWVAPDEMLPGGEALVRNFLLGTRAARRFGAAMPQSSPREVASSSGPPRGVGRRATVAAQSWALPRAGCVGWSLDAFGHPAQLPQILRGFGIAHAIMGRGVPEAVPGLGTPFHWQAPDGSQVLAAFHFIQTTGDLPASPEERAAALRRAMESTDPLDLPVLLAGNGGDGAPPRPELADAVAAFNAAYDDAEMALGSVGDYFDALETLQLADLPAVSGELLSGRYNIMLWGVPSARCYLKATNFAAESALLRRAEPLAAAAWLMTGDDYPAPFLERALRSLLENHFHDTICGCSGDAVYHDAMQRYAHTMQIAQVLGERATKRIAGALDTTPPVPEAAPLLVFNPHPSPLAEPAVACLYLPADGDEPLPFHVVDGDGRPVPSQVLEQRVDPPHQPYFWRKFLPYDKPVRRIELALAPALPSLGCAAVFVAPGEAPALTSDLSAGPNRLENAHLRVEVAPEGTLTLTDKRTGRAFAGLHRFEDEESLCGEYYHIAGAEPQRLGPPAPTVTLVEGGPLRATLRLVYEWQLPESATEDLQGRSERTVPCPLSVDVSLWAGVPRVELRTEFENNARDHRLRVLFPTGLDAQALAVETPFAVVNRPVDLPAGEGWADAPVPESPQQTFADLSDGAVGLALLNRGIPEVGARRVADGVEVALTLLRAVGWIARLHYGVRHYRIPTPDAQCPGRHVFHYALAPHAGDWRTGRVWEQAQRFAYPPQAHDADASPGQGRSASLLSVSPSELVLSAFKRAEEGDDLVVRLWNASPDAVDGQVAFGFPVAGVWRANLAEEPSEPLPVADGCARLRVRGHQIVTVRVRPTAGQG